MDIAEAIITRRAELGLSQQQLAVKAGVAVSGLSNLERGLTRPFRTTLAKLVRALDWPDTATAELLAGRYPTAVTPPADDAEARYTIAGLILAVDQIRARLETLEAAQATPAPAPRAPTKKAPPKKRTAR